MSSVASILMDMMGIIMQHALSGNYRELFKTLFITIDMNYGEVAQDRVGQLLYIIMRIIYTYYELGEEPPFIAEIKERAREYELERFAEHIVGNTLFFLIMDALVRANPSVTGVVQGLISQLEQMAGLPVLAANPLAPQLAKLLRLTLMSEKELRALNIDPVKYFIGALMARGYGVQDPRLIAYYLEKSSAVDTITPATSMLVSQVRVIMPKITKGQLERAKIEFLPFMIVRHFMLTQDRIVSLEFKPLSEARRDIDLDPRPATGYVPLCIILGLQGSGKTTLLRAIEYYYFTRGYTVLDISFDERRQLLYAVDPCDNPAIVKFYEEIGLGRGFLRGVPLGVIRAIEIEPADEIMLKKTMEGRPRDVIVVETVDPDDASGWDVLAEKILLGERRFWMIIASYRREHNLIVNRLIKAIISVKRRLRAEGRRTFIMVGIDEVHEMAPTKRRKEIIPAHEAVEMLYTHARGMSIPVAASTIRPFDVHPDVRMKVNNVFMSYFAPEEAERVAKTYGVPIGDRRHRSEYYRLMTSPIANQHKLFVRRGVGQTMQVVKPVPPPFKLEQVESAGAAPE